MRILISGFIVFVIWSIFSVWLYVEKLEPAMDGPITVQSTSEIPSTLADSVIQNTLADSVNQHTLADSINQNTLADSVIQPEALIPNDMLIYFDFDDTSFKNDSIIDNSVIEFKEWLDQNSESMLTITGYSDTMGTVKHNQILGLERAQSVQNYFQSKGIDATKIMVASEGESQPINNQTTKEGRAKNRRVVITIKN